VRVQFVYLHIFNQEIVEDCRAAGAYKSEPQNFVDAFLKEIDANEGKNGNCQYTGRLEDNRVLVSRQNFSQPNWKTMLWTFSLTRNRGQKFKACTR